MNWDTIRNRAESTPFKTIELPDARIDLYWSKRPGEAGYQVYSFAINYSEDQTMFAKTNGGNYCKESSATQEAFEWLGLMPKDYKPGAEPVPYQYRVGGNFYRIPKSKLNKYKR